MKRREFSLACGAVLASGAVVSTSVQAQAEPPKAGTDYYLVEKRAPVDAPAGKIEVVEFFWYSCGHCNAFEPTLDAWVKRAPKDVVVRRVPVAFRDDFAPQQRLYYVLEAMGLKFKEIEGAIRFSFSEFNTLEEMEYTLEKVKAAVARFRKLGSFR